MKLATAGEIERFNEAAAYHCGKHTRPPASCVLSGCFNEAAAYHCGKRIIMGYSSSSARASMRPQHITAENLVLLFTLPL